VKNLQVTLIGKKELYRINLPNMPIGNYWLSDKKGKEEKKLISIEGIDGKWQILSNNHVRIINPKALQINQNNVTIAENIEYILDKIILKENNMYAVRLGNSREVYILYCAPVCEKKFYHLDIINTRRDNYRQWQEQPYSI